MREGTQIFGGTCQRKKVEQVDVTCSIGQAVKQFIDEQVCPKQAVYGEVVDIWNELLPAELAEHCRIEDISASQVTVVVDSPSHRYELNLCSTELLKELQTRCPRLRLKKLKFVISCR